MNHTPPQAIRDNLLSAINDTGLSNLLQQAGYRYITLNRLHALAIYKIRSTIPKDPVLKAQYGVLLPNLEHFEAEQVHIHLFEIQDGAVFLFSNEEDNHYLGHLFFRAIQPAEGADQDSSV